MTSLRTLVFLVGTAIVCGSEVKVNTFEPSPYRLYRFPAEFANEKAFSFGSFGIPNMIPGTPNFASLVPMPINGISGFLPIVGREDCDHSEFAISGQPAIIEPVPEIPTLTIEETKPLAPIPEAPILPPLALPELPLTVEVPVLAPVPCPSGEIFIEAPKQPEFEILQPLEPLPEPPVLPPFTLPEPVPVFVEEIRPLGPIPEAPVLGPFTMPELPTIVSVEKLEPCDDQFTQEKEPEFIEVHKPIPEAPVLPPFTNVEGSTVPILYIPELPASLEKVEIEELKPVPAAPELPPLVFPAFPKEEVFLEVPQELKPIPAAPELPPLAFNFGVQPIATPIVTEVVEEPTKVIFGAFEFPKLPSAEFCAHTVLKERVIPKFVEKEGNFKFVNFKMGSELPFKSGHSKTVSYIPGYPTAKFGFPVFSNL